MKRMKPTSSYLPSKKFIAIVGVIIVLGGIAYGVSRVYPSAPTPILPAKDIRVTIHPPEGYDPDADTDGDGLKNWEEALWGTNIGVADTDGDGTSDSLELTERRNPLVSTLNDTLSAYPMTPSMQSVETGYANRTNSVSQAFLSHLYAMGASGEASGKATVLNDIIANEARQNKLENTYTEEDIITVPTTKDSLRTYGNTYGAIVTGYIAMGGPYELNIINDSIKSSDFSQLSQLDRFIPYYTDAVGKLRAIPAPESLKKEHLDLVNNTEKLTRSFKMIQQLSEDPVIALIGIAEYRSATEGIIHTTKAFRTVCTEKGVTFTSTDPAYVLMPH
ncbi:MAG: hypothetical protein HGA67_01245 [Candidatus Yonathbacteria bacterium]|nr:hypothetical protein [Candidatus Yonathbacteria bacterium]